MKRTVLIFLIICISCSFCACASSSTNAKTPETNGVTNAQLFPAITSLKKAEEEIIDFSYNIVYTWELSSSFVQFYFVEGRSDYKKTIASKEKVDADLQKAKSIIQIGGTSDYYHAVKAYYTAVKALHSLVYNYPEGYSILTYKNAIQQAKSDCNKAYAEVELYFGS